MVFLRYNLSSILYFNKINSLKIKYTNNLKTKIINTSAIFFIIYVFIFIIQVMLNKKKLQLENHCRL